MAMAGKPLPFFKAFYAGGVGSVRGYEQSSLGPQDVFGNATGGKRKIVGNAELFYPVLKGDKSVRASVFLDAGQIYADGSSAAVRVRSATRPASASPGIRRSVRSSSATRFRSNKPLDKIQHFQFQVGTVF